MDDKKEVWTFSAGSKPNTVTVYEKKKNGTIYARAWNPTAANGKGNFRRISLGHTDKQKAKRYATQEAAKLQDGKASIADAKVTLAQVFALYREHVTPEKTPQHQLEDVRRAELWLRVLGNIDAHKLTSTAWKAFIRDRSSGAIDARGNPVAQEARKPVRARGVEVDCKFLRAVYRWALGHEIGAERFLMQPTRITAFPMPKEKNVRRPIATYDRYETLRSVSDSHMMWVGKSGKLVHARSYLSELLDIAEGTGRRISAICALRLSDLRLERVKDKRPHGAIVWPAETDKMGRETEGAITESVRAAIDRLIQGRMGIGSLPLFPSPEDETKPLTRHTANKWLKQVEKLAGLEKQKGGLWHPYRRKWATERKEYADADVAAAGGWKSEATLRIYQQSDEASVLRVVLGGTRLREVRHG